MDVLDFYGDESCCTGGLRYLALGGIAVRRALVPEIEGRLAAVRAHYKGTKEMKWTRVSKHHIRYYIDFVNVFFDAAARDEMTFTGLYVDTHSFNRRRFNQGEASPKWELSDESGNWAVAQGLNRAEVLAEESKFLDYWTAKAGKDAARLDWDATWRNWVRKAIEIKSERRRP
jgi:hypothetical protein